MTSSARRLFARRIRVDRERMHAAREFGRQRGVYHAMPLDPALPLEGLRHNIDPEMRLPARAVARMAFVLVGFIDHAQTLRRESSGQLFCDHIGCSHESGLSKSRTHGQPWWNDKRIPRKSGLRFSDKGMR
jgi:hypothetical protein